MAGAEAPKIPRHLSETAARVDRGDVREWVATLPEVVADLAERWALHVGKPYEPGGQCSWVAPARTVAGEDLVLKVGWRHPEAAHEADALRVWRGNGAVWLHAAETFDRTSALLLERCAPGMPMGRSTPEPEQDVVVAGLLARLWTQPPAGHPFRPLQAMCEDWAAEFEERFARSAGGVDPGLARAAMVLFRELPRSADSAVLLCTDLHAGNVLAAQREPWLVIDPKPYVGDPTYDVLQHLVNCRGRLMTDPWDLVGRVADLAGVDRDRVGLWLFARCVVESIHWPDLREVARRLAPG